MESGNIMLKDDYDEVDGYEPGLKGNSYQKLLASLKTNKMAPHVHAHTVTAQYNKDVSLKSNGHLPGPVEKMSRELAMDTVRYVAKDSNRKVIPQNKYERTMRRTVDEVSERHDILFKGMMNRLYITKENASETFKNVLKELFSDSRINWGRIVVVYAFGGRLAKYCYEKNNGLDVDTVGLVVGNYVSENLGTWIQENGGWDAFYEYFPEKNSFEDKVWRGLIFTAVGLGTLATLVAAR